MTGYYIFEIVDNDAEPHENDVDILLFTKEEELSDQDYESFKHYIEKRHTVHYSNNDDEYEAIIDDIVKFAQSIGLTQVPASVFREWINA